jgi:hypothetical protein
MTPTSKVDVAAACGCIGFRLSALAPDRSLFESHEGRLSPAPDPRASNGAPAHERVETTKGHIHQAEAVGLTSDPPFPVLPSFSVALKPLEPPRRRFGDSNNLKLID